MTTAVRSLSDVPRVFVVQDDPKKNMVSALDFGPMECLLAQEDEVTLFNANQIAAKLRYGLRYFTERDFLLLVGHPVAIAIAAALVAEQTGGLLQLLKWDQQERRYFSVIVHLNPQV